MTTGCSPLRLFSPWAASKRPYNLPVRVSVSFALVPHSLDPDRASRTPPDDNHPQKREGEALVGLSIYLSNLQQLSSWFRTVCMCACLLVDSRWRYVGRYRRSSMLIVRSSYKRQDRVFVNKIKKISVTGRVDKRSPRPPPSASGSDTQSRLEPPCPTCPPL
ncbi:hypothetical protein LZ31DRAFT_15732 [Colletotrichum somersetense]|nr:hypothetical protein LZ31DRAFT_15732 [Colletotrichum somersetense]